MDKHAARITDSELVLMQELWAAGTALNANELQARLAGRWDGSTVKTLLRRLVTKEAVGSEKREVFYFYPLISQKEYETFAARDLVERVYSGRACDLVAALVDAEGFSEQELSELRALLRGEK